MTPWRRTDSASPEPASPSKRLRGWRGFGWIASTGSSSSSVGAGSSPPTSTSRPRPRPRAVRRARQAPSPPSSRRRLRRSDGRRRSPAARGSAPRRGAPSAAPTCGRRAAPKCLRTSASTSCASRVRASTIVSSTPPMPRLGLSRRRMRSIDCISWRQPLERVVLGLHRHEHAVGGGERVDGQRAERRRAVEEDEVVLRGARTRAPARGSARRPRAARARRRRRRAPASTGRGRGSRTRVLRQLGERRAVEQVVARRAVRAHAEPGGRVRLRVEVDDERPLAGLREAGGEVDRGRRLADAALLVRKA